MCILFICSLLMIIVVIIGIMSHIRCVLGKVVSESYTQEMLSHMRWITLKMFC